jgi:hypothetical protein
MERARFPKPGERLIDADSAEPIRTSRPPRPISILGAVGYGPAHPSWWAGHRGRGFWRLTIANDLILMKPDRFTQALTRRPVVRIPVNTITSVSQTTWGLWFHVPGDPALDGTRFTPFVGDRASLKPLVELLHARGIPVDTMPVSTRTKRG